MPKIVDYAARREELAAAVWALVGRNGAEAATVRGVAAESGWSMGAVRHYFGTQDELLRFSAEVMAHRITDRVSRHYAAPDGPGGPDRACRALEELLPLDADRTVEVLVWLAFMTRARTDPALDEVRRTGWVGERYVCRLATADAVGLVLPSDAGAAFDDPAAEDAVDRIHLAVDGLSLQAATYPEHWPADRLRVAVRTALRRATQDVRAG